MGRCVLLARAGRVRFNTCYLQTFLLSHLLTDGFDVDRDIDFSTDRGLSTIDAPIGAIERRRGFPTGEVGAAHAFAEAEEFDIEHDFVGDAAQSEVAGDLKLVFVFGFFPLGGLKGHGGIFAGAKVVVFLQVAIALLAVGVDRRDLDGRCDLSLIHI